MLERLLRSGKGRAWTVVIAEPRRLCFARGEAADGRRRPRVRACGDTEHQGDAKSLAAAARRMRVASSPRCATLLGAGDYHFVLVEAPSVPQGELRAAMKWRLKEIVDFPVEEAAYDILELPAADAAHAGRPSVFAVAARNDLLKGCVTSLDQAGIRVSVIDVPETAQRNIAALYEEQNRGVGLLYLDDAGALFTVTFGGELYAVRRFDVSMKQIRAAQGALREEVFNQVLLELQRTLDSFERQFGFIVLSKLMVGPEPEDTGLVAYLSAHLGLRVEPVDLRAVIEADAGVKFDAPAQWRLFHAIGGAIRNAAPAR
jgi:MSHA biogenesis protein MshI